MKASTFVYFFSVASLVTAQQQQLRPIYWNCWDVGRTLAAQNMQSRNATDNLSCITSCSGNTALWQPAGNLCYCLYDSSTSAVGTGTNISPAVANPAINNMGACLPTDFTVTISLYTSYVSSTSTYQPPQGPEPPSFAGCFLEAPIPSQPLGANVYTPYNQIYDNHFAYYFRYALQSARNGHIRIVLLPNGLLAWQVTVFNGYPTNMASLTPVPCSTVGAYQIYLRDAAPAPASTMRRRRRNTVGSLCPNDMSACRIKGTDDFECLDVTEELGESCGGCINGQYIFDGAAPRQQLLLSNSTTGVDCLAMGDVDFDKVTCIAGECRY